MLPNAIELGGTEEPDVDPAGLQPVGEDLRHGDDRVGGLGQLAVADRQRQPRRLGADAARLVHEHAVGSVEPAGEVGGRARQADADEAAAAIVERRATAQTIIISSLVYAAVMSSLAEP